MSLKICRVAVFVVCVWGAAVAFAQEGHPLKGSWSGDWGQSAAQRTPLLIVMDFDGRITGTVNPGTDNLVIKAATLDPNAWALHVEADGKDKAGQPVKFSFDGRMENLALYNRSIKGTWSSGTRKGDFKVTRSKGN
jgi:hypothetical protein